MAVDEMDVCITEDEWYPWFQMDVDGSASAARVTVDYDTWIESQLMINLIHEWQGKLETMYEAAP